MKHVILDLETLSVESNALILSIGAVILDPEKEEITEKLYIPIDLESSMKYSFKIDASTLNWWFRQSKEAIQSTFVESKDSYTIEKALLKFKNFVWKGYHELCREAWDGVINTDSCIWGNGSSFDCVILENAYKITGIGCPFNFRQFRDFRTIRSMFKNMDQNFLIEIAKVNFLCESELITHNALNDAIWEARYLQCVIKHLKKYGVSIEEF